MRAADIACLAFVLASTASIFLPALSLAQDGPRERADRTRCANQLRQLGLGAIQYADDKRFYPHVNRILDLDGGVDSNHTPKVVRALLWYGYNDNPEVFVCGSSEDLVLPIEEREVRENLRRWFWGMEYDQSSQTQSPFVVGDDPALEETTELSYGWSRKGMNMNVRSATLVGADRAVREPNTDDSEEVLVGNHGEGWNVLRADCTVEYLTLENDPYPGAYLAKTDGNTDGFLSIKDQDDPTVFRRR
jgi:hypothetical protein